jgi:hypothetical protein
VRNHVLSFAAVIAVFPLTACGGGSAPAAPLLVTIPTTAPLQPSVVNPAPPIVATPSATPAKFSAAQKIDGIQITIPYAQQSGNYTFDFTIEAFYVVGNRLSVLKSFFPSNTNVGGKYGDEFAYSLSGNSATKVNSVVATSMPADTLEIADFNKDGFKDVFIGDAGYDAGDFTGGQNKLLMGSATGLTAAPNNIPTKLDFTHSTAIADVDGDGDVDIFVGNIVFRPSMSLPYFLINNGQGVFTSRDLFPSDFNAAVYTASEFADLDGDGSPELILGGDRVDSIILRYVSGQYIKWQPLTGSKDFDKKIKIVTDVVVSDLNKDGKSEIVMTWTNTEPFYQGTYVDILHQVDGKYTIKTTIPVAEKRWNSKLHVTDVNGDSFPDIVSTGYIPDTKILINDGKDFKVDTTFVAPWDVGFAGVEMWDVNNDGKLDFIFTKQDAQIIPNTLNVGVYVMFGG